jgi:hypothetical protein
MAPHYLVTQLRFARSELVRSLEGVPEEDAVKRILPMNCISWTVGHLANQEQTYWLLLTGRAIRAPGLNELVGYGKPASTPPLAEMWAAWREIATAADEYLDTLTPDILQTHFVWKGAPRPESVGTMLARNIYHYWYHIGQASAVRECLGHTHLPEFVGELGKAPYYPEKKPRAPRR